MMRICCLPLIASVSDLSEPVEVSRLKLGRSGPRRRRRKSADLFDNEDRQQQCDDDGGGGYDYPFGEKFLAAAAAAAAAREEEGDGQTSPYVVTLEDVAKYKALGRRTKERLGGPPQRRNSVASLLSLNDDAWSYTNSSIGTGSGWGSEGSGNGNGNGKTWGDDDDVSHD